MLRNKELLIYSAAAFVITAVSTAFCLTIDITAGIICLLGCLCISGVFIFLQCGVTIKYRNCVRIFIK